MEFDIETDQYNNKFLVDPRYRTKRGKLIETQYGSKVDWLVQNEQ